MKLTKRSESGFSLIELMIVVGIIGVLATMAVPKFNQFQAKAKQTEGKTTLAHVQTLEEAYALDWNKYTAMATLYGADAAGVAQCDAGNTNGPRLSLGFRIQPCNNKSPRFGYTIASASNGVFVGTAITGTGANNKVLPGCANAAHFTINEQNNLQEIAPTIAACF